MEQMFNTFIYSIDMLLSSAQLPVIGLRYLFDNLSLKVWDFRIFCSLMYLMIYPYAKQGSAVA